VPNKIVVTQYVSLDGVLEDPVGMEDSGLGNWTGPFSRGPGGDRFKVEELFAAGGLILGRKTYEPFAAVWPDVKDETGYGERMNALPKLVASTTLKTATWNNSTIVDGDLIEAVQDFKAQSDGDVLIFGSASVVHQLAPHGLVDEYRLMIYPTVLGRGKRLFADGIEAGLALEECRQFVGGIVLLRYRAA
jgi:dihydrofolate reductase